MALNVSAASKVAEGQTLQFAALVAIGFVSAAVVTELLRNNLYDIQMAGGDAIYGVAGAGVTYALLGVSGMTNALAGGMLAGAMLSVAEDFNVV